MQNQAIVNLENLQNNYKIVSDFVGGISKCATVLKGNCYGLGQEIISYALLQIGVKNIFCFSFDEGVQTRKVANKFFPNKEINIYILNGIFKNEEEFFHQYNLVPVLNNEQQINIWANFAKKHNSVLDAILQFDTGMNRSGFPYRKAEKISKKIKSNKSIKVKYIMSHLACADEQENPRNSEQWNRFKNVIKFFPNAKKCFANSDGTILNKEFHADLVRVGKGLYSPINWRKNKLGLKQVLSFSSYIKEINGKKAIVAIGYKQGYFSNLANYKDSTKNSFVYCNERKLFITKISENDLEILLDKPEDFKVGDKVEIASKNVLLDKVGENSNNIFYILQISLVALNKHIIKYKGLSEEFKKQKIGSEILDLINTNQKKIELDDLGNLKYFKSYITEIREIEEDDEVGYGGHYKTKKGEILATMPIGYSDGFIRALSNTGFCIKCNDIDCEVVGNISMNQTIIKIPNLYRDKINLGDEVLLFDYKNTKLLEEKLNLKLEEFVNSVIFKNKQFL